MILEDFCKGYCDTNITHTISWVHVFFDTSLKKKIITNLYSITVKIIGSDEKQQNVSLLIC